ncbi:MAG TPA: hypothetical protein QGI22_00870 [Candidatus Woesearchaeota archaeon]|jgi:hypothetical protein|nr:hypothetical protein [Candidatus Woesearchaeota archaeon]HJN56497.1 hypothetical protein [Candidatus Woesearchaeota archaeon]
MKASSDIEKKRKFIKKLGKYFLVINIVIVVVILVIIFLKLWY